MKTTKSFFKLLSLALLLSLVTISCEEQAEINPNNSILPESFGVDIPSSISNPTLANGGRISGRTEGDIAGDDIYELLGLFVAVGEGASDIVENIMTAIRVYNIESIQVLTYTSDEDGRDKTLTVIENAEFEGVTYQYQLTIIDADSEGNQDGGKAMQVFWNNSPVEGIAIMKPYNIDRLHDADNGEAVLRVDYNSVGSLGYDATMEVSISGLTLDEIDQFSLRALRMFVGKKGDVVDVYGNTSHPNAQLFSEADAGFNWAFVASGNDVSNIGVAEVGLPSGNLDSSERSVLLDDYSLRTVFTNAIEAAFPTVDQTTLDALLVNTNPPGYFDKDGFLRAGTTPGEAWNVLATRLEDLTPYNPLETTNLDITFK
jgi:hypothetical protein